MMPLYPSELTPDELARWREAGKQADRRYGSFKAYRGLSLSLLAAGFAEITHVMGADAKVHDLIVTQAEDDAIIVEVVVEP